MKIIFFTLKGIRWVGKDIEWVWFNAERVISSRQTTKGILTPPTGVELRLLNAPEETWLILGEWADYCVRNGIARNIEQSEVSNILTLADKAN